MSHDFARNARLFALLLAPLILGATLWVALGGGGSGGWVEVADLEELGAEGVIYSSRLGVFVVEHEGEVLALGGFPHVQGKERALFCRPSESFVGQHGELFDKMGVYIGGPAPQGLDRMAVKVEDGVVSVDPERVEEGPPRGQEALPMGGRRCEEDAPEGEPGFLVEPD